MMKHKHLITVFVIFIFLILVSRIIGTSANYNSKKCTDTDPNSRVDTKGAVKIKTSGGTEQIFEDSCISTSASKVTEVNCDENGEIARAEIECPKEYVCNDGRCVKATK